MYHTPYYCHPLDMDMVRQAPPTVLPQPLTQTADSQDTVPANANLAKPAGLPAEAEVTNDDFYYPLACGDKLMNIKPANMWVAEQRLQPVPKKLFGGFWQEGELCMLYADTNMGKSILAVQIGDSISRGEAIATFELETEAAATLYIDFELRAKQFEMRYSEGDAVHRFSPGFYRAEYNTQMLKPERYHTFINHMQDTLDWALRNTLPRVLIIDNITCLSEGGHHAASVAISLMKYLKTLQVKNKLSILVLAHSPKRDAARPISVNDLGGSKMLMNFADSAFAIGQSYTDANMRYLKQMKQRSGPQQYGAGNVCLCRLERQNGFLKYEFWGYGDEAAHLRRNTPANRAETVAKAKELHQKGLTQRQIAEHLGVSAATVNRMLDIDPAEAAENARLLELEEIAAFNTRMNEACKRSNELAKMPVEERMEMLNADGTLDALINGEWPF